MNTTDVTVTAGLGGFFVLFGLGLVVWLLMRDMSRRMRKVRNDHARGEAGRPAASQTPLTPNEAGPAVGAPRVAGSASPPSPGNAPD